MAQTQNRPESSAAGLERLMSAYQPLPGVYDELLEPNGNIRPHWQDFILRLGGLGANAARQRVGVAERHLRDSGVLHRVYDDQSGKERAWPLNPVPLLIAPQDWRALEAGLIQRANLLEAVVADLYGPASLVKSGVLPAAAVAGSSEFLRPMVDVTPVGDSFLRFLAVDLGRAPDGRWWVLGDRTQAPSGAGYALENRLAMTRAFSDIFGHMNVERLAGFFQQFRAALTDLNRNSDSRICLMTPGPLNETYFEHAYLARYLGFELVEGSDLMVRDDKLFIRTVAGLRRTEVVLRRLDADWADPLELNPRSRLGVPGLAQAVRARTVAMANALGSGVLEARSLRGFLPEIANHLYGEDLALPGVATWWCGQPGVRDTVLRRLDELVVAPAYRGRSPEILRDGAVPVADMEDYERAAIREAILQRGQDYVAQDTAHLSTAPVWVDGHLEARPFSLRVFLAKVGNGWTVMPGGFCRIANHIDARAVSMQKGSRSADVWVLSDAPVNHASLLPTPEQVVVRRHDGAMRSRAADNLFWLGRYIERAESTLRLVRALAGASLAIEGGADTARVQAVRRVCDLLIAWGAAQAQSLRFGELRLAEAALFDPAQPNGMVSLVRSIRNSAGVIRDRLSPDAWRAVTDLTALYDVHHKSATRDVFEYAEEGLRILSAFAGLANENMNQFVGWRFLQLGVRLERAIVICRFVRRFGDSAADPVCYNILLELCDSQITYRQRYMMAPVRAPILDLVVLELHNPRSVAFQLDRIVGHLQALPQREPDGRLSPPERMAAQLWTALETADAGNIDEDFLDRTERAMMALSDLISFRYFTLGDSGGGGEGAL